MSCVTWLDFLLSVPSFASRRCADALRHAWFCVKILILLAVSASAASAQPIYQEAEPNSTCTTAQNMVGLPTPLRIQGYKSYEPFASPNQAADFFRFYAAPGTPLHIKAELDPARPAGSMSIVTVGLFTGDCPSTPWAMNYGNPGAPTILDTVVPSDGYFVVAVTAAYDGNFSGSGTLEGPYLLQVGNDLASVNAIRGKLTDKVTGAGLSGAADPFAWVQINNWDTGQSWEMNVAADGSYVFTGVPTGRYVVGTSASQYQVADYVDLGTVAANEDRVVPDIRLLPNPVRFVNVRPCASVPASGGVCRYAFEARLSGAVTFSTGIAWNIVDGQAGGIVGYTQFQACEQPLTLLTGTPLANRTVYCQFTVPAKVPDDATLCANAYFGDGSRLQNPRLAVQGAAFLFCMNKRPGAANTEVMPRAEAVRRMRSISRLR